MGYYTYYQLSTTPELPADFPEQFELITDYPFSALSEDSHKWYDHEEHMCTLSRMYPNHIFTLEGDGEEQDDKWRAVYVNGNSAKVYVQLTYPTIDIKSIDNIGQRCPELFL